MPPAKFEVSECLHITHSNAQAAARASHTQSKHNSIYGCAHRTSNAAGPSILVCVSCHGWRGPAVQVSTCWLVIALHSVRCDDDLKAHLSRRQAGTHLPTLQLSPVCSLSRSLLSGSSEESGTDRVPACHTDLS